MAGVSKKPVRDRSLEFQGFLNDLQDWDYVRKEKYQKPRAEANEGEKAVSSWNAGKVDENKGPPRKVPAIEVEKQPSAVSEVPLRDHNERFNYLRHADVVNHISSSILNEERSPDAASEKELGNEYFKQKKFHEAIECYSRSIALAPTSVAFANRAMSYLKVKRFEEAEIDCTEALNLDDRYIKAYSRRATARKELGKLKASMEDSEFAMRLDPNNQELKKQYNETKSLLEKEIVKKTATSSKKPVVGIQKVGNLETGKKDVQGVHPVSSNSQTVAAAAVQTSSLIPESSGKIHSKPSTAVKEIDSKSMRSGVEARDQLLDGSPAGSSKKNNGVGKKHELKPSMQDVASRAASRVMASAGKNITAPKSAYQFEASWRALSNDCASQVHMLKTIPSATLPQIFKNALSAPLLIDIIRCTATFFKEETELAVSILDNLAKVSRFNMIVMCLSAVDRSELQRLWDEVFFGKEVPEKHMEMLNELRSKYCQGEWQSQNQWMDQSNVIL